MKIPSFLLLALLALLSLPVAAQTERTLTFRNGPKLAITVPMGYSFESRNNTDGSMGVLMENPIWGIKILAVVAPIRDPSITTRAWQENKLIEHIAQHLTRARESDYNFKPLTPVKGSGFFCVFSALGAEQTAAPEPGTSTHVTGGIKCWPGCVVLFHIFSNGVKSAEYQEALDLFNWSITE